jgi:hypothetical protein
MTAQPTTARHNVRPELLESGAVLCPVEDVGFYPGNARLHDDEKITTSLRKHGQYAPVLVNRRTMQALKGNGTFHAIVTLGWTHVGVSWIDVDEHQAAQIVAMDNASSDAARNDEAALAELLQSLNGDLEGSGYDQDDIDAMLASLDEPLDLSSPGHGTSLAGRFGAPPFTILDARRGPWRARKQEWLALGIRSELGREADLLGGGLSVAGQGGMGDQMVGSVKQRNGAYGAQATTGPDGKLTYTTTVGATSIFDPVLCELVYRWFSAEGHHVLDPWAGGSVRGVVASHLGRRYTGVELRQVQVDANEAQLGLCPPSPRPTWVCGESTETLRHLERNSADLIFGCPPYYGLERYSDDPRDLSNMSPAEFDTAYAENIAQAAHALAPNSFAVFVVGNVRHPSGRLMDLAGVTTQACAAAGLALYNDAILITPTGSLAVRAGRAFERSRVLGRSHQQVLVYVKGDRKKAAARAGTVDLQAELEAAVAEEAAWGEAVEPIAES